MALFVRQDQERTRYQEKIAADLKNKLATSQIKAADTSPAILDDEHQTKSSGIAIIVLVFIGIIAGLIVIFINK